MSRSIVIVFFSIFLLATECWCGPVIIETTTVAPSPSKNRSMEDWNTGLEYDRYLKEIVNVLEDDDDFRKKMETADPEEFKTGEISKHLNFLSHNIRTKLDEVKRQELTRLRSLVKEQSDRHVETGEAGPAVASDHIDVGREEFDEEDLKRLIKQTTADLAVADEVRRKDFKEYEMDKEHMRREKLKTMDERTRVAEVIKLKDQEKQHKEHPKLHHPGSKAQLEEVWEETDGLPKEEFDPKTFFKLHDLNQDNVLDQGELEALFQKELDKVYDPSRPEDDMRERIEEMARMREHVMKQIDKNGDGMVSYDEFIAESQRQTFEEDPGWNTLDEQKPVFNEDELKIYEGQINAAFQATHGVIQGMAKSDHPDPEHPGGYNPNKYYPESANFPPPHDPVQASHHGEFGGSHPDPNAHKNDPNSLNSVNIVGGRHH